ncbi:FAS1 domain-containing protein [Glonium stellatum]|uniref:FAS1 domain-containing protein n=1 Tax=Glonium stellatum TaxID=574774 RepID=A0A8E2JN92_9PEZI|nr:FAS1 domain-containing protein [Glonium stellatum]
MSNIEIESHRNRNSISIVERPCHDKLIEWKNKAGNIIETSKNYLDDALLHATDAGNTLYEKIYHTAYDVEAWLDDSLYYDDPDDSFEEPPHPPHHGLPHRKPHHRKPHHPPHHHKSNITVYELIAKSKYTTKLAKLINDDDDLVKILNGTKANYTVFAPTDKAFEKIPKHGKEPSKEFIKDLLLYHISPEFYPAGKVLYSYTIPTLYEPSSLGHPQRLTVRGGFHGLTINFYSKIVVGNIFGTNGVIHAVDSIIIPPPKVANIINLIPTEFSTLTLGLTKTGILEKMNTTAHIGGTLFAPSNFAFKKLGPKINAFLFSKFGVPYLKALLKYHIVANQTLYSDAFYDSADDSSETKRPGGYLHFDLPTALKDRSLAVDVARYGPFVSIKINGFTRVTVHDGVAKDGVIQVVGDVLIPPKKLPGSENPIYWEGEEMSEEEFKERLDPLVEKDEIMEL